MATSLVQSSAPQLAHTRQHALLLVQWVWVHQDAIIAGLSAGAILLHLCLRVVFGNSNGIAQLPLFLALAFGGVPLVWGLLRKLLHREFGSDLLAGISIVTAVILGEYLAGTIVVLMLSGGEALENYAVQSASSVLAALAKRMPSRAYKRIGAQIQEVPLESVSPGDTVIVHPHDICPVDGVVMEGSGGMDESYLTGEPFKITKTRGSMVMSGAINGDSLLTIQATKRAADSRYAKIMEVMRESEATRPRMRRLGDQLGAAYTPLAVALALVAWAWSADPMRFLSVLVIATPCPLLIAIPVAIIGTISLCARRAIIVRNPAVLEQVATCRTAIFDKTGTLTYGEPVLVGQVFAPGSLPNEVLALVAGLESYSRHPLSRAILEAAKAAQLAVPEAVEVSEEPGKGLRGVVNGHRVLVTSRTKLVQQIGAVDLPEAQAGLECAVAVDGRFAAIFAFRDAPRPESRSFIAHLAPMHGFSRTLLVSGDRESEVRYLADQVGIQKIYAGQSPEQKLDIVRSETSQAPTLYVGDGINDAPAMMSATVGVALGQNSDVTTEAAGAVVLDNSLEKVDEFLHISRRLRRIALQSALGGMAASLGGMLLAASGHLNPVAGAVAQEVIDVIAVLNALRAAVPTQKLSDL